MDESQFPTADPSDLKDLPFRAFNPKIITALDFATELLLVSIHNRKTRYVKIDIYILYKHIFLPGFIEKGIQLIPSG